MSQCPPENFTQRNPPDDYVSHQQRDDKLESCFFYFHGLNGMLVHLW